MSDEGQELTTDYDLPAEQLIDALQDREVPSEFWTGVAGTGKTYSVQQRIAAEPDWALLCSTTGISAVNLGAVTLNSALGYFDEASLRDCYLTGSLGRKLRELVLGGVRNLLVEECSMLTGTALDLLYRSLREIAESPAIERPLGIILVGDACQLPPIKGSWFFEADCWEKFRDRTLRLTKIWRQDQPEFLTALNRTRAGDGAEGARLLGAAGVVWETSLETEFDGTTILPKNDQVDRFNEMALMRVQGKVIRVGSRRWGKQRGEWKQVPERTELKEGAYVMVLANKALEGGGGFEYVNGDCGHVVDFDGTGTFTVKLVRNGEEVEVGRVCREYSYKTKPDPWRGDTVPKGMDAGGWLAREHYRAGVRRYVTGQVEYFPLRLAYASTVHKSQGLSLDRVQIDFRNSFFRMPAMLYVAISRCRTLQGLRLVGQPETFAKHCNIDPKVREWL